MKPAKIANPPASTPNTPDARSPSLKRLPSGAPRRTSSIAAIATTLAAIRAANVQGRLIPRPSVTGLSCTAITHTR